MPFAAAVDAFLLPPSACGQAVWRASLQPLLISKFPADGQQLPNTPLWLATSLRAQGVGAINSLENAPKFLKSMALTLPKGDLTTAERLTELLGTSLCSGGLATLTALPKVSGVVEPAHAMRGGWWLSKLSWSAFLLV